jgi:hypothetical protein
MLSRDNFGLCRKLLQAGYTFCHLQRRAKPLSGLLIFALTRLGPTAS